MEKYVITLIPKYTTACQVKLKGTQGKWALIDIEDYEICSGRWTYSHGYFTRTKKYKRQYLHRLIMNATKDQIVDHINGDTLDNRKCNLRIVNKSLNTLNRHNLDKRNTSGYTGVFWNKKKKYWYGLFKLNKKKYYVPSRKTALAVSKLRQQMIKELLYAK